MWTRYSPSQHTLYPQHTHACTHAHTHSHSASMIQVPPPPAQLFSPGTDGERQGSRWSTLLTSSFSHFHTKTKGVRKFRRGNMVFQHRLVGGNGHPNQSGEELYRTVLTIPFTNKREKRSHWRQSCSRTLLPNTCLFSRIPTYLHIDAAPAWGLQGVHPRDIGQGLLLKHQPVGSLNVESVLEILSGF